MWSTDSVQRASRLAAELHQGQIVKGTTLPYLLHVTQVAAEVMAVADGPEDCTLAVVCAFLHDTLEDTSLSADQLEANFGPDVRAGVQALTKNLDLPKKERMADSLQRILAQPSQIAWVKLADRITNLQPPPADWGPAKIAEYVEEAWQIHAALAGRHPQLGERLARKIAEYGTALR